jgi:hypothetical protein
MSMSVPFGGGGGYWYAMMSVMGSLRGPAGDMAELFDAQGSKVGFEGGWATAAM